MKKILLFLMFSPLCTLLKAQEIDNGAALKLVSNNRAAIGLSDDDLQNVIVSNAYISYPSGIQMVYLQQSYKGLPVFNQLHVLAFRNGELVSKSGGRIKGIENKSGMKSPSPALSAETAVRTAMAEKKLSTTQNLVAVTSGKKIDFGKLGIANENVTAELMWVPVEDGKAVRLSWQVYLVPKTTPDNFLIRVDAVNNKIINETNLTLYCNWTSPRGTIHDHNSDCSKPEKGFASLDFKKPSRIADQAFTEPTIIDGATYRVIPFPAESPIHPGGAHALRTDPWSIAPGNATTLKWHSNGTTDFNITRGNNVWAQEDLNANNGTGFSPTSTTGPDPLTFNFTPDFNVTPTQTSPVPNHQFNITNLFYWNNIIHDITYQYGFDEAAGNFQANNLGRGGAGNDFVFADAQNGNFIAPNQNNASFFTPADGGSPRMQMFLFDSTGGIIVNSPAVVAGSYPYAESNFSIYNKLINVGPVTGQVVYYNDNTGGLHEACVPPSNSLTGKIALINRGTCNFVIKVKNAQNAGAIAVIMVNNVPGALVIMSGDDSTITIPAVFISDVNGALFAAQLANNLNVTLFAKVNLDGDVDNGIMVHEYAHGISNRLTGGPAQVTCVSNAEEMGEGWSDYYALMLTQDWANANVNTGFNTSRGIGTYAFGQGPNDLGIRSQKYCTNFAVNNLVFSANLPAETHDRGEIWCATLWDMTWNIIQQVNSINPNLYNTAGGGGNTIALRLVTEGMKLQPCGPGFIDARNAILQADQILYGGAYSCAIKEAFRRRGMGILASQGSANSTTDQVSDFSASLTLKLTQNVTQIPEGQNIVYTNTVSTCNAVTNYLLTDTLPTNVTYVSGGTYNASNRVVSFPVNLTAGQTQTYSFTVTVNTGSFFPTVTFLDEPFAAATMPATLTQTSTTSTVWNVTNVRSHSTAYSVFSPNIAIPSDQILTTTTGYSLGANPSQLSFWHLYDTEAGYDGGVVEISTDNGTNWNDLGANMNLNGYNGIIDAASGTPLAGKPAFTGLSASFIKTSVTLASYVNQTAKFRWRFSSDDGTSTVGWYVDDILVKSEPLVYMRSSLFNTAGVRIAFSDTVTLIIQTAVCTNVSITTQPANTNACTGSNATFIVVAAGTLPTYQWQVSTDGGTTWTNVAAATSASLALTSVTSAMNNYRYRVIVNNTCPSTVTSNGAILTVSNPASITSQPTSVTVCAGNNASFTVTATGTNITYQWQVSSNGGSTYTNITGATAVTLTLTGITSAQNGNIYRVVVFSCSPTGLNSNAANLTVNTAPAITTQPANTIACTGNNTTFTVTATGTSLTYQWQVSTDGGTTYANISGQTTSTLILLNVTLAMSNNRYRVIINGSCPGPLTSTGATLTVINSENITTQPANTSTCTGNNATFTAIASGSAYQWQVSTDGGITWTNVTGASTTTLTLTAVTASMNNNQYRLVVSSCTPTGLNSNPAILSVNNIASITTQPANTSVCNGSNATFTVTAAGTAVTYQWQISTDGGVNYTNVTGATNATLNITAVSLAMNNNRYRVIVTNTCPSSITSNGAVLTVNNITVINTQPANTTVCAGSNASFNVVVTGSSPAFQWQVSTDGGTTYNNIASETGTTLSITNVTAAMNNNRYRVLITGCGTVTSSAAILISNLLPNVMITASPSTSLLPDQSTTITATTTPAATSYSWFKNGVLITGATTNSIIVLYSGLGDYTASVTDANNCSNISNLLKITDSTINTSLIFPNPNGGQFYVRYNVGPAIPQSRVITIFDAKGARVYNKVYVVAPYEKMEVNINHLATGIYMLELSEASGKRLAKGKVMVL